MARDFRNKTFQKVLRGYAQEEVDEYLAYLNEEYRKLERQAAESERKFVLAQKKLEEAMKKDGAVGSVGPAAREAAAKLLRAAEEQAKERADRIAREAEEQAAAKVQTAVQEAENILAAAKAEAEIHKNDAKRMYVTAKSLFGEIGLFREKMFNLYNEHLDAFEGITDAAQDFMDEIDESYPEGAAMTAETEEKPEEEAVEEVVETEEVEESVDIDEAQDAEEIASVASEGGDDTEDEIVSEEDAREEETMSEEMAENLSFMDRLFASQLRSEETEAKTEDDLYIDLPEEESDDPVITIDWKNRSVVGRTDMRADDGAGTVDESDDFRTVDGFDEMDDLPYDEEEPEENYDDYGNEYVEDSEEVPEDDGFDEDMEEVDAEEDEYSKMDAIFNEDPAERELSLTDEFNIIFSEDKSRDNVKEISRQPTIAPEAPQKGKKHKGF